MRYFLLSPYPYCFRKGKTGALLSVTMGTCRTLPKIFLKQGSIVLYPLFTQYLLISCCCVYWVLLGLVRKHCLILPCAHFILTSVCLAVPAVSKERNRGSTHPGSRRREDLFPPLTTYTQGS